MKKLIIALFAFAAMFAVAGSVSATEISDEAIIDSDTDIYDATNAYIVSAVLTDAGNIDLIVKDATTTVYESVETDVDSLVGITYQSTDYAWYAYIDATNDLHVVNYKILGPSVAPREISDVVANSDALDAVMSDSIDSAGYPVFLANSSEGPSQLNLISNVSDAWGYDVIEYSDTTSVHDVYLTGGDQIAYTVYFMDSLDDVYSTGFNYSTDTATYDSVVVDNTLTSNISGIVAIGMDNGRVTSVYQTGTAEGNIFKEADFDGSVYDVDQLTNVGTVAAAMKFDAITNAANTAQVMVTIVDQDTNYLEQDISLKSDGSAVSTTNITNSDTDYINSIVYAGFNSINQSVLTYSTGDISILDGLYSTINAGAPTPLYQEQEEGESIPELPSNSLWKVLIAVLALGLVVGIAAFMKKKKK